MMVAAQAHGAVSEDLAAHALDIIDTNLATLLNGRSQQSMATTLNPAGVAGDERPIMLGHRINIRTPVTLWCNK